MFDLRFAQLIAHGWLTTRPDLFLVVGYHREVRMFVY